MGGTMKFVGTASLAAIMLAGSWHAAHAQSAFGPSNAKETYYWISQNSTLPLFVRSDYKGMKKIAEQLHIRIRIAGPTNIDLGQLIATIGEVCAQRPAGISVVGWDPALTVPVQQCVAMHVPTVVDDADLPGSGRLAFIGTDWHTIGDEQAKAIIKALPNGGKIAVLSIVNADNMKQAVEGFTKTLKAAGKKYQIVASEDDTGDAATASRVASSVIAAHRDIAAIAGFDSESGPGIVEAVREAGMKGKIVVTAMEQSPEFFKTLLDGSTTAIIVQNRELFTYYAFRLLYDFHHNGLSTNGLTGWRGKPIPVDVNTGVLVVTKDNVGPMLKADAK